LDPFEDCLRKGRLKPIEPNLDEIRKELETAAEELLRARSCFRDRRYDECLVQSYFAMFRSAKALVRKKGYRDTNMYSLLAALRKLYVEPGELGAHFLDLLSLAKDQKDLVYEGARCSVRDTKAVWRNSEDFCARARELVAIPDLPPLPPPEEVEPPPAPAAQPETPNEQPRGPSGSRNRGRGRWEPLRWRGPRRGVAEAFRPRVDRTSPRGPASKARGEPEKE
jgi:uncharacterized protein (UPF0332 family)